MDYEITSIDSFNGKGGKVSAIEVFNTVTGSTICFTIRRPFETKQAWIDRAFAAAQQAA